VASVTVAYDERLVKRLRRVFADRPDVVEKKMFGGIAFMVRGHMCCGVNEDALMARVGPDQYEQSLARGHARKKDFTGKPMKGFIYFAREGIASAKALRSWVAICEKFKQALPAQ
jgi:hypothetical protein